MSGSCSNGSSVSSGAMARAAVKQCGFDSARKHRHSRLWRCTRSGFLLSPRHAVGTISGASVASVVRDSRDPGPARPRACVLRGPDAGVRRQEALSVDNHQGRRGDARVRRPPALSVPLCRFGPAGLSPAGTRWP